MNILGRRRRRRKKRINVVIPGVLDQDAFHFHLPLTQVWFVWNAEPKHSSNYTSTENSTKSGVLGMLNQNTTPGTSGKTNEVNFGVYEIAAF